VNKNIKLPSNKNFGIVFFIVFLLISVWPILDAKEIRYWSLVISLFFLILGVSNSKILTPLNKLWMKFGIYLGSIVAPIVMFVIYFLVITPTGIILRIFNKDILRLKKNSKKSSYWIKKDKSKNSMRKQY